MTAVSHPGLPARTIQSAEEFNEQIRIAADHHRNGRPRSALAAYEPLARCPAAPPETHYDLAVVLRSLGRHQEALRALTRYLAVRRDDFNAWTNAGDSARELGRSAEALAFFSHALTLAPKTADARSNTGAAHHNVSREMIGVGDIRGALIHAELAVSLNGDPEMCMSLGEVQFMAEQFDEGWENYEARFAKLAVDHFKGDPLGLLREVLKDWKGTTSEIGELDLSDYA